MHAPFAVECTCNLISHSTRDIYVYLSRFNILVFLVILEITRDIFSSRSASHCSVLSWVISTSTPWKPPTAFLAQSSSSHTCSSCSSSYSTCSWPSLTTLTLKSSPTSPHRRASLRSATTSRRYVNPSVIYTEILPTISIHCHADRCWELRDVSPEGFGLKGTLSRILAKFKEMIIKFGEIKK